jgi:hypothetical protein
VGTDSGNEVHVGLGSGTAPCVEIRAAPANYLKLRCPKTAAEVGIPLGTVDEHKGSLTGHLPARKTAPDVYPGRMFPFEFCLPTRSTIVPHGPDWRRDRPSQAGRSKHRIKVKQHPAMT